MKAIVTDLDGTLLNEKHRISTVSLQALKHLHNQGAQLILATGRHYLDALHITKEIGQNCPIISANGAQIHSKRGELLRQTTLDTAIAVKAIALSRDFNVHRNMYLDDEWVVEDEHEPLNAAHPYSGFRYTARTLEPGAYDAVLKLFFSAKKETLEKLRHTLLSELNSDAEVVYSQDTFLEVMARDVSKGDALQQILSHLAIPAEEIIGFGDSMNDLTMLRYVGHPVLMANAQQELRNGLGTVHYARANTEDGVAHYLTEQKKWCNKHQ